MRKTTTCPATSAASAGRTTASKTAPTTPSKSAASSRTPRQNPARSFPRPVTGNPLAASFDLTDAYAGSATKVIRSARFDINKGTTRITDEITAPAGDVVGAPSPMPRPK